jgi:hypothetical protein
MKDVDGNLCFVIAIPEAGYNARFHLRGMSYKVDEEQT